MTGNSILHESKHIEWSIKNFFDQPEAVDHKLESACVSLSGAKWFLRICINGETRNSSYGYISLYLMKKESTLEHDVICSIGFKNVKYTGLLPAKFKRTFSNTKVCGWGCPKFIERCHLLRCKEHVAPNGILTVFCTFRTLDRPMSSPFNDASMIRLHSTLTLIDDLHDMYWSSFQSDLTIIVKNNAYLVHRFILSSRSSVFKSMLSQDMMEKNSGRIDIPDVDPETFEDFLFFLYTGQFDAVSTARNAMSLYIVADKYEVKGLKDACVHRMIDEVSDDIFCDVLHFATTQNDKDLLTYAKDYFISNAKAIVTTEKWHTFLVQHPLIANELIYQQLISIDNIEE